MNIIFIGYLSQFPVWEFLEHNFDLAPVAHTCNLATQEAEIRKIAVQIQSRQIVHETLLLLEIMSWDMSLWGRLAGSNVYCAGTDPEDLCPKAETREQRSLTLYTLASRLQKQKAKPNPHMAACDFIGYFISPVLCDHHISIF
jgi:hypothetical protein